MRTIECSQMSLDGSGLSQESLEGMDTNHSMEPWKKSRYFINDSSSGHSNEIENQLFYVNMLQIYYLSISEIQNDTSAKYDYVAKALSLTDEWITLYKTSEGRKQLRAGYKLKIQSPIVFNHLFKIIKTTNRDVPLISYYCIYFNKMIDLNINPNKFTLHFMMRSGITEMHCTQFIMTAHTLKMGEYIFNELFLVLKRGSKSNEQTDVRIFGALQRLSLAAGNEDRFKMYHSLYMVEKQWHDNGNQPCIYK